ncbi:MAG: trigger factor [Mycoplasma sp.]|nr:trigger factor [Mycoplasma sp.]
MLKREINKKTSELKITVVGKKAEWEAKQESARKTMTSNLEVDGFRKGKVPTSIAKKHIKDAEVWHKALPKMLDKLVIEASNEIKEGEIVLDSPYYNLVKLTATEIEVEFIYPIYPEIKLSNYKDLKTKYKEPKFDEKILDSELEKIRKMHATTKIVSTPAKKGSIIKFDFEGFLNNKPFDGGKADGHELELGSGQFIPGFEEQLEGVKSGDEKTVSVTFPKEYHSEELKGKDVIFKCKIHEIKEKQIPELNDELAKEVGIPEVKTVSELKSYTKNVLKEQLKQQARIDFKNKAFIEIQESTELIIPISLVGKEIKNQEQHFTKKIQEQGFDKDTYLKMTGVTNEQFSSQMREAADKALKDSLVFAEIAKLEKIELKEEDYEKEYKKLSKVYGQSVENIKKTIQKTQMQIPMTNERVIDILINSNK